MTQSHYEQVGQCVFGAHRLEGALSAARDAMAAAPQQPDAALGARVDDMLLSVNGMLAESVSLRHDSADGVAGLLERVRAAHLSVADLLDQLGLEQGMASRLRERAVQI